MNDAQRNSIKLLARTFYDYQRERIRLDGMLGLKKSGESKAGVPERDPLLLATILQRRDEVQTWETAFAKDLAKMVKAHSLWDAFLKKVKGCGPQMAAVIISEFDIEKADTVSKMWAFAGLAPGKDRRIKGEKCPYNQFLRAKLCGVLGSSFLKSGSEYRIHYDNMKQRLENSDKVTREVSKGGTVKEIPWRDCTPDHRHKAAIRYMVKMFLIDLYVAWRTLEGLPTRDPYQQECLGHEHSAKS